MNKEILSATIQEIFSNHRGSAGNGRKFTYLQQAVCSGRNSTNRGNAAPVQATPYYYAGFTESIKLLFYLMKPFGKTNEGSPFTSVLQEAGINAVLK